MGTARGEGVGGGGWNLQLLQFQKFPDFSGKAPIIRAKVHRRKRSKRYSRLGLQATFSTTLPCKDPAISLLLEKQDVVYVYIVEIHQMHSIR